ncbi:MAG: EAL domain-containing protein [gamma proteobacterium symbiont of Taylorina sp.]|nr:EAL domain-containing protein [gamma proteobacterium symbiont of Taylorina sp.]
MWQVVKKSRYQLNKQILLTWLFVLVFLLPSISMLYYGYQKEQQIGYNNVEIQARLLNRLFASQSAAAIHFQDYFQLWQTITTLTKRNMYNNQPEAMHFSLLNTAVLNTDNKILSHSDMKQHRFGSTYKALPVNIEQLFASGRDGEVVILWQTNNKLLSASPVFFENRLIAIVMLTFDISLLQELEQQIILKYSAIAMLVLLMLLVLFYWNRDRRLAQESISNAKDNLQLILDSAQEGIYGVDKNGNCTFANLSCTQMLGYSSDDEIIAQNIHQLAHHSHPDGRPYVEDDCPIYHAYLTGEPTYIDDDIFFRKDGSTLPVEYRSNPIKDMDEIIGAVVTFSDITERKQSQQALLDSKQQLEDLAYYDPLTGLPNRRMLDDRIHQAIAIASRQNTNIAICFLDLDGFKPINDELGHEAGDLMLSEVAKRITHAVRDEDTVARVGGDEFVLVLGGFNHADDGSDTLKRILTTIAEPYELYDRTLSVTASMGVSIYPKDNADTDTLLRHADQTMYVAKQRGRNQFLYFDDEQEKRLLARHEHFERISEAISHNELVLYYQPKVNMRKGLVYGVEALVRWQHPELGLLPPNEFLPLIEGHELSEKLDQWVIKSCLSQLENWKSIGIKIIISINISPLTLEKPDFIENFEHLMKQYPNVSMDDIEFEILETAALDDISKVSTIIEAGNRQGLSFALDDFGTGYSSLTYYRHLAVRTLKIDLSFVKDMLNNSDDLNIVESIINLARIFDMEVVAEGMESEAHGALLIQLGCDRGQGFGIARPMPAGELSGWLENYQPPLSWATRVVLDWPVQHISLLKIEIDVQSWVYKFVGFIEQGDEQIPPDLSNHDCPLGKWYETEGQAKYGHIEEFKKLFKSHQLLHDVAEDLTILSDKDSDVAVENISKIYRARDKLLKLIHRLQASVINNQ